MNSCQVTFVLHASSVNIEFCDYYIVMCCVQDDDEEDAESGDDEAELMAELQKIKKERAAEIARRVSELVSLSSPDHCCSLIQLFILYFEAECSGCMQLSTGVLPAHCETAAL